MSRSLLAAAWLVGTSALQLGALWPSTKTANAKSLCRVWEEEARAAALAKDHDRVVEALEELEALAPAPKSLLDSPRLAKKLHGTWRLVATGTPSSGGAVDAAGLRLRPESPPIEVVDVKTGTIANEMRVRDWIVRVAGRFDRGRDGRTTNVEFDEVFVFDAKSGRQLVDNQWIFPMIRKYQPHLLYGKDGNAAWVETTYVGDDCRIGRGNKGGVFFLERVHTD
eukprot:CAMPEP_0197423450 /NCGR_PEP_ID=MMETSP1170-20131217/21757_1 /TAXON_ID=54406 /ORGANISM="Sarcinochrysis sp, Strain CCMP770" /LENGTH=223 /DNA_ID=CAMNT_0042950871 /DNA_START=19 /DNA_END=690 /DNA_ORIENTATION=+